MVARPHADTVASCRLAVCGTQHMTRQALLLRTYWRTGVPVLTTDHEISSSDTGIYSRNVEHMGKKRNAYETFILTSEEKIPHG
jgi:hypothetical protein